MRASEGEREIERASTRERERGRGRGSERAGVREREKERQRENVKKMDRKRDSQYGSGVCVFVGGVCTCAWEWCVRVCGNKLQWLSKRRV